MTAPRNETCGCGDRNCPDCRADRMARGARIWERVKDAPRDYQGCANEPAFTPLASAPGDGEEPLTHCACRSSAWMPFGASYRCTVCHRMSREEQRSTIDAMFGVVSPVAPHAAVEEPESTVEMANASVAANPEGAEALVRRVTAAAEDADLTALRSEYENVLPLILRPRAHIGVLNYVSALRTRR
jgi:hypothetical protein